MKVFCSCGHHPLVCDECRTWFSVNHDLGVPAHDVRPPKLAEIAKDDRLTKRMACHLAKRPGEDFTEYLRTLPLLTGPTPDPAA